MRLVQPAIGRQHLRASVQDMRQHLLLPFGLRRQLLPELGNLPQEPDEIDHEDRIQHGLRGDARLRHHVLDLQPGLLGDLRLRLLPAREGVLLVRHCPIHDQGAAQCLLQDGVQRLVLPRSRLGWYYELHLREHAGQPLHEAWLAHARPHDVLAQVATRLRVLVDELLVRHQLPWADVDRALAVGSVPPRPADLELGKGEGLGIGCLDEVEHLVNEDRDHRLVGVLVLGCGRLVHIQQHLQSQRQADLVVLLRRIDKLRRLVQQEPWLLGDAVGVDEVHEPLLHRRVELLEGVGHGPAALLVEGPRQACQPDSSSGVRIVGTEGQAL
mmetsp:Transcript_92805/g.267967  ORF Transcript_92805/g.267967 Transcript_92805/m.267967 type:complete len:327 (-) Transcript_92805:4235-5215(-)